MTMRKQYFQDDLAKAVEAFKANKLSSRQASKLYGVPRATIIDYSKKEEVKMERVGPGTVLTAEEEEVLVLWLLSCLKRGFPRQDENLLQEVQKILIADGRDNPFTDNKPRKFSNCFVTLAMAAP